MESEPFDSLSYRERNSVFRVANRNFEKNALSQFTF